MIIEIWEMALFLKVLISLCHPYFSLIGAQTPDMNKLVPAQ